MTQGFGQLMDFALEDGSTHPGNGLVVGELGLVEPKADLLGSGVEGVRSVDQVSAALLAPWNSTFLRSKSLLFQ